MTLFDRVKKLSKEQGISLLKLNEKAGLGKNAIYKWKTQQPSTENLQKVADALYVSVDYLLGNETTKNGKKTVELSDEDNYYTFDGKPVSKEDMELFKRLMRGK